MGRGIIGIIPISFKFIERYLGDDRQKKNFQEYAADDFFDFYNETQVETPKGRTETHYTIKTEILLPSFKEFFFGFHDIIRDDWALRSRYEDTVTRKFNDDYDKAVASGNIEDFLKHFDDDTGYPPLYDYGFDAQYTDNVGGCLLIYNGSYKAYLEVWSTLRHMELLLRAAMRNPLAKVVRFGMSM